MNIINIITTIGWRCLALDRSTAKVIKAISCKGTKKKTELNER